MKIESVNRYSVNQNFKGWDEQELNILGRNEEQMRKLGLDFQKAPYEDMYEASKIHNMFGIEKRAKTLEAFCKLLKAVESVKEEMRDYKSEIKTLELIAKIKRKLTKKAAKRIADLNNKLKSMERDKQYLFYFHEENNDCYEEFKSDEELFREQTDWLVRL